jgi:hypothetical protein
MRRLVRWIGWIIASAIAIAIIAFLPYMGDGICTRLYLQTVPFQWGI